MEFSNGDWVRGRCLGRGSAGEVHLAVPAGGSGGRFAVKSAETARAVALRKECEILSSLRSPYVVSCLGSGVSAEPDGRVLYNLFLEYVPGGSLAEVIRRQGGGGLEERAVREYARGILRALEYVHSLGVVHCDVKGQNVLVVGGERVKLADFGCARRGPRSAGAAVEGTPLFMAPEVARGEEQGPEADVWALGCTVVEMATGRPPWPDTEDPVAAVHRIAFSGDTPEIPARLSAAARDFLSRCLRRDPKERWTTAALLAHPFVGGCGEDGDLDSESELEFEFEFESPAKKKRRSSPKSILDQDQWASWGSEDDEETERSSPAEFSSDSAEERLARLAGVSSARFTATDDSWEENSWVNVRNSSPCSISPSQDCPVCGQASTAGGDNSPAAWTTTHLPSPISICHLSAADPCSCNNSCTRKSSDYQFKAQDS